MAAPSVLHDVFGPAGAGIRLGLAPIVPADVPSAYAHLEVFVLFGMLLRIAQLLGAKHGKRDDAAAVSVEQPDQRLHELKPLLYARSADVKRKSASSVVAGWGGHPGM